MKNLLFLCILLLCCACEEDRSVDPTIMPPASTTGENTIGCLKDGWVYASGRFGKPEVDIYKEEGKRLVRIQSEVGLFTVLSFTLVNPSAGADCDYIKATFDNEIIEDGKAHITRFDDKILSGTFASGDILNGRFDVKYQENKNDY